MTENETDTAASEPVVIPNVHTNAVSGLDHAPLTDTPTIYGDADETSEGTSDGVSGAEVPEGDDETEEVTVIAGTTEERLAWVAAGEDEPTRADRASAVYTHALESGTPQEELETLGAQLRAAVYGLEAVDGAPDPSAPEAVAVPGTAVESETAGTGETVNAETGEVTPPGEPQPAIEQDGGTPLAPPEAEETPTS